MEKVRVGIVGGGIRGSDICRVLALLERVEVVAIAGDNIQLSGAVAAYCQLYTNDQAREMLESNEVDLVIEASDDPAFIHQIRQHYPPGVPVLDQGAAVNLLLMMGEERERLLELERVKSELSAILHAMQEAIEVVDRNGIIKYVNPAFTRVTGIPESLRIGQSIFEVSPQGALAQALQSGQSLINHRTRVGGSGVEVISNAAPIFSDGVLDGAVVVFQPMNDILKLMDELNKTTTIIENLYARIGQISGSKFTFDDLIGKSRPFKSATDMARKAARSNSTVLITGESGTGKELYAHAIHHSSERRDRPFIKVNCAAIPENLLESEFFGHEKGAFTGAVRTKLGKVELANGGTLFLDEIGDMNLFLQAKLLRVLQDMEFERVGGTQTIKVDVRVIAATNRDLKSLIRRGVFREDLYYRLNVVELNLPSLRERKEDIPLLIHNLIIKFNRKLGKRVKGISSEAVPLLVNYHWPGNIRELENVLERAMVATDEEILSLKIISQYVGRIDGGVAGIGVEVMPLEKMEQLMLKAALTRYGATLEGKKKAAQALNISLATLYNKLRKYQANYR
ncbi:Fis family transcriptional regulator [Clostridiales bacterium PH28_bin88]|nr:Fis family transcriptional regulator [Clostridiales bacterium PH28_bin88]